MTTIIITFWQWLFKGAGGEQPPGWKRLRTPWLALHVAAGALVAAATRETGLSAAGQDALPFLCALLIATAVAFHRLMQSPSLDMLGRYGRGLTQYTGNATLAIGIVLTSTTFAALLAAGVPEDLLWDHPDLLGPCSAAGRFVLYSLASMSIHECWSLFMATGLARQADAVERAVERKQDK